MWLASWLRTLFQVVFRGGSPRPRPGGLLQCTNYQTQAQGYGPNPTGCAGGTITVYDFAGNLIEYGTGSPHTLVRAQGAGGPLAHQGLESGLRTEIRPSAPAAVVEIELVHYAQPARVTAFDNLGAVTWQQVMTAPQGQPQQFHITPMTPANLIGRVEIQAPADETLTLMVCLP